MADISTAARERAEQRGQALPGGRFPIRNRADLQNAILAVGRAGRRDASEEERERGRRMVRRFIMRRARALGAEDMIPETWNADGSLKR